ncbi:MAG: ABC transporter permease subunit [Planctomycetes bacterium]|nr:ABC transporter permease subunit [Planctomycetota bacterium]
MLTFGINESSIVFVLIMGSFFAIAIALRDGLRQTPPIYRRAALMLGARRFKLYYHVLLPAAMPAAASSLRQGFSFAWRLADGRRTHVAKPRPWFSIECGTRVFGCRASCGCYGHHGHNRNDGGSAGLCAGRKANSH